MKPIELRVRPAGASDLPVALQILTQAAEWEASRGMVSPWPVPFPEDRVRPSLERGELFLAEGADGQSIATVTLQWEDPPFWGERPPDAGYIHRLAVRREFGGRGAGYAILRWAEDQVRAKGRQWLRLDTLTARERLHEYYQDFGFLPVGRLTVRGLDVTLFEKRVPASAEGGEAPSGAHGGATPSVRGPK